MKELLSREDFKKSVFARDGLHCAFCDKPAVDAHHILDRKLFPDGGYYLDNGVAVCEEHHIDCEKTIIPVEEVRLASGITRISVPPHLYDDQIYDKWGNPILSNGQRLKGELFFDESVQKILKLAGVLDLFVSQVKYPRTHHLPWSEGINDDDRIIKSMSCFQDKRVIVTEKMDGENTSLYTNTTHARSADGRSHSSRNWVKQFWSQISHDIPDGWRICGENLFAKHSIYYEKLPSLFLGFSIWDEKNFCLDWDSTLEWFRLLGIIPVPILYDGVYNENIIKQLWDPNNWETSEGYVIRLAEGFTYSEFKEKIAKFVRKGHVQTTKHWMHGQRIQRNLMYSG